MIGPFARLLADVAANGADLDCFEIILRIFDGFVYIYFFRSCGFYRYALISLYETIGCQ